MLGLAKIEKKLTTTMQNAFSSTKDRKNAVHLTAVAGAGIVAALPVGIDAWALRLAEVIMVICIAASYGEKLTKSAAKGLMLSSFAQLAGETAALTALEAAETAKVASIGTGVGPAVCYGIKASVAVSLIEAVGHLVIDYYEKPNSLSAKVCKTTEKIGLIADISRVTTAVSMSADHTQDTLSDAEGATEQISFGHSYGHSAKYWLEKAAEEAEAGRRSGYEYAMKRYKEAIEYDAIHGHSN